MRTSEKRRIVDDKMGQRVDFVNQMTGQLVVLLSFRRFDGYESTPSASVPGFPSVTPSRGQQARDEQREDVRSEHRE